MIFKSLNASLLDPLILVLRFLEVFNIHVYPCKPRVMRLWSLFRLKPVFPTTTLSWLSALDHSVSRVGTTEVSDYEKDEYNMRLVMNSRKRSKIAIS